MWFYNLSSYVKNWLFLQDIKNNSNYKLVVFENKIDFIPEYLWFDIKFLLDSDENFIKQINGFIKDYDNVLLVLDQSHSWEINDFLQLQNWKISILNLNTWIASIWNKSKIDFDDIYKFLSLWFEVYDPWDLQNLFHVLSKDANKYIRLNHNVLPDNIMYFEDFAIIDKDLLWSKDILSFVNNWFAWLQWTVISLWWLVPNVLQALQILQSNACTLDFFAISNLDFEIKWEILDSLSRNELAIFIIDQNFPNLYSDFLKDKLKKVWLDSVRVKFIYPEYDNLNTILDDYKFEEVWFDWVNLAKKINNIVKA